MDRLISEQAVLDVLNEANRVGRFYCGKNRTIEEIKAIPSVESKTEWIPVSEPPKKDGKYLVTLRFITHDAVETAKYSNNLHKVDALDFPENKAGWYNYDSEYGYYEQDSIIAWMPLPPCYEPQERSE